MNADDRVSADLAAKMLGVPPLSKVIKGLQQEDIDGNKVVRLGDMVGLIRRSRFRLRDAEEFENDPGYFTLAEQKHFIPIAFAAELVNAEPETLVRWAREGKVRSRDVDGQL